MLQKEILLDNGNDLHDALDGGIALFNTAQQSLRLLLLLAQIFCCVRICILYRSLQAQSIGFAKHLYVDFILLHNDLHVRIYIGAARCIACPRLWVK